MHSIPTYSVATKPEASGTPDTSGAAAPTLTRDGEGPTTRKMAKRDTDEGTEAVRTKVDRPEGKEAEEKGPPCTVCGRPAADPLRCSQCTRQGHPRCLELPEHMLSAVRT